MNARIVHMKHVCKVFARLMVLKPLIHVGFR